MPSAGRSEAPYAQRREVRGTICPQRRESTTRGYAAVPIARIGCLEARHNA